MDFNPEEIAKELKRKREKVYYDLCCRKNMHKLYHATNSPCPCKKVQEKVRMDKFYEKAASILIR